MSETTATTTGQGNAAYDAANSSPARRSFVAFPTNSRRELTPQTRREIVKKSRALEANCPFLTRILSKFSRHAVGSGIHFKILSDDAAFNDAARRDVEEWWNNPGVFSIDSTVDGWESQKLAVEQILLDGEFNAVLAKHPASDFPAIQILDVFEIENPPIPQGQAMRDWDDGVRINEYERPIEFAVRSLPRLSGDLNRDYRFIPAESMIHLGRRRRSRGHRFMPYGYSGLNKGIDALDLEGLITGTAKLHSALAVSVKGTGRRGKKGAIGKIQNAGGTTTPDADTQALEKVFGGGMINYLGENGEMNLHYSQHPTVNQMEFIKMLLQEMALPYDVPFSVMWSMSEVGGTAVRYDAEDAQGAFDILFDKIAWGYVRRQIIWKVSKSIKEGRIAAPKDPLWFTKLLFRGPRKITVDIGRMAQAFKTLTRNAGMSIPRWFDEQGLDADTEMDETIRFLARTKRVCEENGLPFETVFEPTPGSMNNIVVQQPEN